MAMAYEYVKRTLGVPGYYSSELSLQELVGMTPLKIFDGGSSYRDEAAMAAQNLFVTHLKNQSKERSLFFENNGHDVREGKSIFEHSEYVRKLMTLLP